MKKIAYSMITVAAFCLISTSASAEWVEIEKGNGVTVYIDKSSILRDGNRVVVSTLDDLEIPNKYRGGFYHSTRWLEHYDCIKRKHRMISSTFYADRLGKGEIVETFGPTQEWDEIPPKSAAEKMWKIACDNKD